MIRTQAQVTAKEGSRIFREALRVGEEVEKGLKIATCKLPFAHRLRIAWRVMRGTWR